MRNSSSFEQSRREAEELAVRGSTFEVVRMKSREIGVDVSVCFYIEDSGLNFVFINAPPGCMISRNGSPVSVIADVNWTAGEKLEKKSRLRVPLSGMKLPQQRRRCTSFAAVVWILYTARRFVVPHIRRIIRHSLDPFYFPFQLHPVETSIRCWRRTNLRWARAHLVPSLKQDLRPSTTDTQAELYAFV